jgi:hypothetical protein
MGLLRKLFGPSKDEIWRQLSAEIGGDFVKTGFFKSTRVAVQHNDWMITLDAYTESSGETSQTYTRMRAPYVNQDGFRFTIYRKGFFSELGKLLGTQDIEIGEPAFDDAFIIQGTDESKVQDLFGNRKIRDLIEQQPRIHLTVRDDEGWFGTKFPEGVDELYFRAPGVVKDLQQLKALYELFAEVLNHLCHIGSAYENDPGIRL